MVSGFKFQVSGILLLLAGAAHAISPPDRIQFADGLYTRGLYDLAIKEYLPLLTNQPPVTNLDAVLFRSGESFRHLADKKSAAGTYEQLLNRFPGSAYAWRAEFRRAELFATGGEYIEAINYFHTLVDKNPPADIAASALYYLGYSQARMNMRGEAGNAYRRVVKDYPDSPFFSYACIGLADLERQQGAGDAELRELYDKAARKPATPRVGAEAWFQIGEIAFRQRDYAKASEAYEQLLMRYPSDERADEARLQAGWSFHNVKRYADALKIAESALKRGAGDKQEVEWRYLKANCLRQLQRNAEARQVYAQILKERADLPLAAAAAYEQALIAFKEKDYPAVVAIGARVAETNEYARDFYWMLAEAQSALTNVDGAIQYYRLVAEKFPDSDRAPLALFQNARLLHDRKDWKEASELYRKAAEKDGALAADALFASAYCRNEMKDKEEMLRDLASLSGKHKDFKNLDRALYQKAQVEVELKKEDDARTTLERLLKQFPKSGRAGAAHYLLGSLLEKAGHYDVADYHYQAALAKNADAALAGQIQFRRAAVLQRQGKNVEAAALLQDLVKSSAHAEIPAPLLEWLARYNLQNEKYAEADASATALAQSTRDPVWKQIAWYIAGRGRQGAGQPDRAREAYEQALGVDAKTREGVEAALQLGQVGLETSDYSAAEKYYAKAAELASSDDLLDIRAQSYFGLGETARARQEWDDASRYFMSVAVLFDDATLAPQSLYYAAEAFGKLERPVEKEKALSELKQRYPDSEWSKKEIKP